MPSPSKSTCQYLSPSQSPLIDYEQLAIDFIIKHTPESGNWAGMFSGGKDSVVLKHLSSRAGCIIDWYYSLMPDPPELIKFVRTFNDVNILKPEYTFFEGITKNFPPHRKAAWCCRVLKEKPSTRIPHKKRLLGIRSEESKKRSKLGWINQVTKKRINYHPLYDWKEWQIWEYIERYQLSYCNLYDEGFERLGCIVCPKRTNSKSQELFRKRYPEYFRIFERKVTAWWEEKGKYRPNERAKTAREYLDNWYKGK